MKQTAVECLIEYFVKQQKEKCSHWCIHDLIAQLYVAKEMEKEQMKNMWRGGQWSVELGGEFDEYYNETFNKK